MILYVDIYCYFYVLLKQLTVESTASPSPILRPVFPPGLYLFLSLQPTPLLHLGISHFRKLIMKSINLNLTKPYDLHNDMKK